MLTYAKFLKENLLNKKKLGEHETVMLTEESNTLLQKRSPPKPNDLGSFTVLCIIYNDHFDNALCNLGASINIMLFFRFQKLKIGEVKPSTISLHLADRFIVFLERIIEDVLIKIKHFIFSVDFVVHGMEENTRI